MTRVLKSVLAVLLVLVIVFACIYACNESVRTWTTNLFAGSDVSEDSTDDIGDAAESDVVVDSIPSGETSETPSTEEDSSVETEGSEAEQVAPQVVINADGTVTVEGDFAFCEAGTMKFELCQCEAGNDTTKVVASGEKRLHWHVPTEDGKVVLVYVSIRAEVLETIKEALVTYRFEGDTCEKVMNLLPNAEKVQYGLVHKAPSIQKTVKSGNKTYTFEGWTPEVVTITGDVTFVGTWSSKTTEVKPTTNKTEVEEVEEYTIKHVFLPKDGSPNLPEAVLKYQPADVKVEAGSTYKLPTFPTKITVNNGYWETKANLKSIKVDSNKVLTYYWTFTPYAPTQPQQPPQQPPQQEKVVITIKHECANGTLPGGLSSTIVVDKGTVWTATTLANMRAADNRGAFIFKGYSVNSLVANSDVTVTAYWDYQALTLAPVTGGTNTPEHSPDEDTNVPEHSEDTENNGDLVLAPVAPVAEDNTQPENNQSNNEGLSLAPVQQDDNQSDNGGLSLPPVQQESNTPGHSDD